MVRSRHTAAQAAIWSCPPTCGRLQRQRSLVARGGRPRTVMTSLYFASPEAGCGLSPQHRQMPRSSATAPCPPQGAARARAATWAAATATLRRQRPRARHRGSGRPSGLAAKASTGRRRRKLLTQHLCSRTSRRCACPSCIIHLSRAWHACWSGCHAGPSVGGIAGIRACPAE